MTATPGAESLTQAGRAYRVPERAAWCSPAMTRRMATLIACLVMGPSPSSQRALIRERQREGIAPGQSSAGRVPGGRKKALSTSRLLPATGGRSAGEPKAQLAREFNISPGKLST